MSFLKKIFSGIAQFIAGSWAWMLTFLALIVWVSAQMHDLSGISTAEGINWLDVLKELSAMVLVGSLFGAIIKSYQFSGLFKETLTELVYADDFVEIRADLESLWGRITSAIYKKKFPELDSELHGKIIQNYLPTNMKYYYSQYDRRCIVKWHDRKKTEVMLDDELTITIVPENRNPIVYDIYFKPSNHDTDATYPPEVTYFSVNGEEQKMEMLEDEEVGGGVCCKIPLNGADKYHLVRRSKRIIPIDQDPYAAHTSSRFIVNTTVKISCLPDDLRVRFQALGTPKDFETHKHTGSHDVRLGDIDRSYSDLMFPNQGYMLLFQEIKPKQAVEMKAKNLQS